MKIDRRSVVQFRPFDIHTSLYRDGRLWCHGAKVCVGSSGVGIGLAPYGTRVLWLCVRGRAEPGWYVERGW